MDPASSMLVDMTLTLLQQITLVVQDGSFCIWDILTYFVDSGRKWRGFVHLYVQSMVQKCMYLSAWVSLHWSHLQHVADVEDGAVLSGVHV